MVLFRGALAATVVCLVVSCSEAVTVEPSTQDAGVDAGPAARSATIRSISPEIDLAGADDRALGFIATGDRLVSDTGARTATVTRAGVEIVLDGAPIALGHPEVNVSGAPVVLGAPEVDASARATRRGVGIDETLESRLGVLEQRWHFAERPSAEITVRVPIPGAILEREDTRGLHLVRGAARFVYSHARFVDAGGAASDIPATFEDGAVVLRVSATLVQQTRFPAVLDPTIGPEIPVTDAVTLVRDTADEQLPAVAMIGTRAISVWGAGSQIRCNYVDASESTPTHATKVIATSAGADFSRGRIMAATAGPVGLAVYLGSNTQVRYVRFDSDCNPLDASLRALNSVTGSTLYDVVAYDGGFLVAWSDISVSTRYIRPIGPDGTPRWAIALPLTDPDGVPTDVRLLPLGTDVIVVYRVWVGSGNAIRARRLTTSGTYVGTTPVVIDAGIYTSSGDGRAISAVRTNSTVVMCWSGGSQARSLAALDPTTLAITTPAHTSLPAMSVQTPLVAFDGSRFGIGSLDHGGRVHVQPLDPVTLAPDGPEAVSTLTSSANALESLTGGQAWLVAAQAARFGAVEGDTMLLRVGSSGTTEFDVSLAVPVETGPAVASTGAGFMATWARLAPAPARVRGIYVSSSGTLAPSASFTIGTNAVAATYQGSMAASSSEYLLSYLHPFAGTPTYYTHRMTAPIAADVVQNSFLPATAVAAVNTNGQLRNTYVEWGGSGAAYWYVAHSQPSEMGVFITSGAANRPLAGANELIALGGGSTITIVRALGGTSSVSASATQISLAYGGGDYLLVWVTSGSAVGARLLRSTGEPYPPANITLRGSSGSVTGLSSVWTGTRFVVSYVLNGALVSQRLDGAGVLLDATPGTVVPVVASTVATAMAADVTGQVLLLYGRNSTIENVVSTRVYGRLVDYSAAAGDANGTACTTSWNCASGVCADGVCCDRACGGPNASCEACSVAAGGVTNGTCTPKTMGVTCRAVAGPCDVAETCTGSSATCPVNGFTSGTVCAAAGPGVCDAPDVCDGTMAACPAVYMPMGTACRVATDVCDVPETCTGLGTSCPNDAVATVGASCRPSAGPCDLAETCNGASKACPLNAFRNTSTQCRASASTCDRAELCPGNAADCPSDAPALVGQICRSASGTCDVPDRCDGVGFGCPADEVVAEGVACRASSGVCDVEEQCDGVTPTCPANAVQPRGVSCRSPVGACDAEERCDGVGSGCPQDAVLPSTATCRNAAGACDVTERCTGNAKTCPPDQVRPGGTVCRAAAGVCDVAEACDGTHPTCIDDGHQVDGTYCDDGLVCNGEASCAEGACVEAEPLMCESASICNEAVGACIPENRGAGCAVTAPRTTARTPSVLGLAALFLLGRAAIRRRHR